MSSSSDRRRRLGRVLRALDEEPIGEDEAREAVEVLGLDIDAMAARIRRQIAAHSLEQRDGLSVCSLCGVGRSRERETACRGALPPIGVRGDGEGGA